MSVVSDNLKYIYTVKDPGPRAFTMPKGFHEQVEIHLWGAGGGRGTYDGGGGGYVKSIVTIAEGDIVEIGVGRQGSPNNGTTPGTGGASSIGFRYSGGTGGVGSDEDGDCQGGAGGGGATVILVNGTAVAVAGGGGGGGGYGEDGAGAGSSYSQGHPGGEYTSLTSTTQGGTGGKGTGGGGGGGGGYFGGAGAPGQGDDRHGAEGGSGGQNYASGTDTVLIAGSGSIAGGRNTKYAPGSAYGNAGEGGYAVIVLTRRFNVNIKDTDWKRVEKAFIRVNGAATSPSTGTEIFSTVGDDYFEAPINVKSVKITYMTPDGIVSKVIGVGDKTGQRIPVKIGSYGEDSRFGSLVIPAYSKQVFRYVGNVDHLLNADVGVVTTSGQALTVNGSNSTEEAAAAAAGITYTTTYEGWHGDLSSTLYFTPARRDTIITDIKVVGGGGGRYSGQPTFTADPSLGNNYVMGIQIYDPYGGEGSYDVTATLQQTGYIKIEYDIPGDGGWKEVYQIYERVNGRWLPFINRRNINDGRSEKWLVQGTYSWTAPDDVIRVKAMVYGAGGSGTGGAGGAGGYAEKYMSVTPGQTYAVVVGAGGVGNNDGQTSSFNGVLALGGASGNAATYGTDAGGAGGTASGGDINLTGEAGGAGQAVFYYHYWWWGWGGYYGWNGYNIYGYGNYGYYGNGWSGYSWGGYWGWGWPYRHYSGYNFGTPGTGYDQIGNGAVGRAEDSPTGAPGAVFLIY